MKRMWRGITAAPFQSCEKEWRLECELFPFNYLQLPIVATRWWQRTSSVEMNFLNILHKLYFIGWRNSATPSGVCMNRCSLNQVFVNSKMYTNRRISKWEICTITAINTADFRHQFRRFLSFSFYMWHAHIFAWKHLCVVKNTAINACLDDCHFSWPV